MLTVFNGFYVTRHCWIHHCSLSLQDDQNVVIIQTLIIINMVLSYGRSNYMNRKFDAKVMFLNVSASFSRYSQIISVFNSILPSKGSKNPLKIGDIHFNCRTLNNITQFSTYND